MSESKFTPEEATTFHIDKPDRAATPSGRVSLITDDLRSPEELLEGIRRNKLEQIQRGDVLFTRAQHNYSTDSTIDIDIE